jgi:hypothetical protein
MKSSTWKEEIVEISGCNENEKDSGGIDQPQPLKPETRLRSNHGIDLEQEQKDNCYNCYDRAFHSSSIGIEAPPVRIVDLVSNFLTARTYLLELSPPNRVYYFVRVSMAHYMHLLQSLEGKNCYANDCTWRSYFLRTSGRCCTGFSVVS